MSEDIRQLVAALINAKKLFGNTGKSAMNNHQNYAYAKLEDIYKAVDEYLLENNVYIVHYCSLCDDGTEVLNTRLIHSLSGQWIQDSRVLFCEKPGNQAKGATNTYMKKYAVLCLCAIAAQEDDDCAQEESYIHSRNESYLDQNKVQSIIDAIKLKFTDLLEAKAMARELFRHFNIGQKDKIRSELYNDIMAYIREHNGY